MRAVKFEKLAKTLKTADFKDEADNAYACVELLLDAGKNLLRNWLYWANTSKKTIPNTN
jgi:hypothetical protein